MTPADGLLVIVPTRGRRANCERLLGSFRDTASPGTDLLFVTDPDDTSYEDMDWAPAACGTLAPRGTLQQKLNETATAMAPAYRALMWTGDDHVFKTHGWDTAMLATLDAMGGHGWVYPQTVRRGDVPEIWLASTSIVETLGWFFPPHVHQYYGDNSVAELGKRSGLIRWCPAAEIPHLHYSVTGDTAYDDVYKEAEAAHGQPDLLAFRQWQADVMPNEVARLRRAHSRDVAWVLSKIA